MEAAGPRCTTGVSASHTLLERSGSPSGQPGDCGHWRSGATSGRGGEQSGNTGASDNQPGGRRQMVLGSARRDPGGRSSHKEQRGSTGGHLLGREDL